MIQYCALILASIALVASQKIEPKLCRKGFERKGYMAKGEPFKINLTDWELCDGEKTDKVLVKVYYESLCPGCRQFYVKQLAPTYKDLSEYMDLETLPYGNAKMVPEDHGHIIIIECQHGPDECYGNVLHACALDLIKDSVKAVQYVACMMADFTKQGSDDKTAEECGEKMKIDAKKIESCVDSCKGAKLAFKYARESVKVGYKYVPYVVLNGQEYTGDDFKKAICDLLKNPPESCKTQ